MGTDSFLMTVWRSAEDGFTGKGEPDVLVVLDSQGTSMGAE